MDSHDVVALVGHLVWPVTILLLVVLFRGEAKNIASAVRGRIADRNADVAITRTGIEIRTNLEAVKARLDTLEVGQDQQGRVLLGRDGGERSAPGAAVTDELRGMASAYLRIDIPDWAARTRAKDDAANSMGLYVVRHEISRDELVAERDEGLVLALASAVLLDPQPGDADRLLNASSAVRRLHIRYRVLLAFNRLLERRLLTASHIEQLHGVLDQFRTRADPSLLRRIDATASLLATAQE